MQVEYTGIDIVKDAIVSAQEQYTEAFFQCGNFMEDEILSKDIKYDYVVSCGIFALKQSVSQKEFKNYWKQMIKKCFTTATVG